MSSPINLTPFIEWEYHPQGYQECYIFAYRQHNIKAFGNVLKGKKRAYNSLVREIKKGNIY